MLKKIFNIGLYSIIIIGIIILIIGSIKLIIVKKEIANGAKEIEEIFNENNFSQQLVDTSTKVEINDQENEIYTEMNNETETKGIGLLTIKADKEYKIGIYENVTPATLKKGAARLTGSGKLNQKGNCVLYGHRDSAFRPLWNINIGDTIVVKTFLSEKEYKVYNTYITEPENPEIIKTTDYYKLTLVTCYPFVYSGAAKQRFIVECKLKEQIE